jgi:hypothetical protein
MSTDRIVRVRYFTQQFLRTQDFTDEQAYHLAMLQRHNIGLHAWGIVEGLKLVSDADSVEVEPGFAIDGYGRSVVLSEPLPLPTTAFIDKDCDELEVWLQYGKQEADPPPAGYGRAGSGPSTDEYYRWEEVAIVSMEKPDAANPDADRRRHPKWVADPADVDFKAFQQPKDGPWGIYLGKVTRNLADPKQPVYTVDLRGRPVAGVVGDKITAPSQAAEIALERQFDANGKPWGRFKLSLAVPPAQDQAAQAETAQAAGGAEACCEDAACCKDTAAKDAAAKAEAANSNNRQERLGVSGTGEIDFTGKTRLQGPLQIQEGGVEFGELSASPLPADAAWGIYRCKVSANAPRALVQNNAQTVDQQQLRIVMPSQGGEVVIGAWSPVSQGFVPFLTVADGAVKVHGNLVVKGNITKEEPPAKAKLTPEAKNFLAGSYSSGVGGANLQLEKFYQSPFTDPLNLESDDGQRAAIDYLLAEDGRKTNRLGRFVEKLLGESKGMGRAAVFGAAVAKADWLAELLDKALASANVEMLAGKVVAHAAARAWAEGGLISDYLEEFMDKALAPSGKPAALVGKVMEKVPGMVEDTLLNATSPEQFEGFVEKALRSITQPKIKILACKVAHDEVARGLVEQQLLDQAEWVGDFTAKALALGKKDRRSAVVDSVMNDAAALGEIEGKVIGDANLFGSFMAGALANETARQAVATRLLASADGREAVLKYGMPATVKDIAVPPDDPLNQFAGLVRDHYRDWLGQFLSGIQISLDGRKTIAKILAASPNGPPAVMDEWKAGSMSLSVFVELLQRPVYKDRLPYFAAHLLNTPDGRKAVAEDLEGRGEGREGSESRRNGFVNLDWLPNDSGVAVGKVEWFTHYGMLAQALSGKLCDGVPAHGGGGPVGNP